MAITVDVFTKIVETSLRSSTDTIERKFAASGQKAGEEFGKSLAAGIERNPALQKQVDRVADLMGKQRIAQEQLNAAEAKGTTNRAQLIKLQENLGKATRDVDREIRGVTDNVVRFGTTGVTALDGINRSAANVMGVLANLASGTRFGALTAEVANMSAGFATASTSVGGMSASMMAAAGIAGGAVVVGLAAAAAGAVSLTTEIYQLGAQFDDTFDNLQVKTGATGDVLNDLKSVVKDVAGVVPESFGTIGDITAQVTQTMELTTAQTEELVTALGHLKHMGVDVNIHSLGQAFQALDVNQQEYLKSTEQVLNLTQTTGLSFDSITSAIEGNAGALKVFGFTFGEALTIIKEFEDIGLDPDKGLGALTKAFKALTDAGLEPTKQNLGEVFDEIKGFIDSGQTERANEELNTLFGPRGGGLSWLPLIKEGKLSLDDLTAAAEAPSTSIDDLAARTYDLSESWQTFKNSVSGALEPLSAELFNLVNESLEGITQWIERNKPEIIGFFTGLTTQVVNFVQVITGMLGTAIYDLSLVIPDFMGGDKIEAAGQSLMDFAAKLDEMQGRMQAAGDKANSAARDQRDLADNTKDAADATNDLSEALERAAAAPPIPFTPGAILGPAEPGATGNPFNPGGVLGPGVTGPTGPTVRGTPGRGFPMPWTLSTGIDNNLLSNVPAGRYMQTANADLTQGLADCSSAVEDLVNIMDGMPTEGRSMSTHNAAEWLTSRGFVPGYQEGAFNVAFNSGHMQATLPGGTPFNWGSDSSAANRGVGGSGALDPALTERYYRPVGGGLRTFGPRGGFPMDTPGLPPGTPSPIPGLNPGPVGSTFGYNEFGEPGYYRPDSNSIRGAERAAENAEDRVAKADKRITDLQQQISELEAERTLLNAEKTDEKIKQLQEQLADAQDAAQDAREDSEDAQTRLADARQGRFTAARAASAGRGGGGGLGQIGAPLAEDMGLSQGLPGLAQFGATALANLAFAPMIGALSAVSATSPAQGGYGLMGMLGAANMAGGGSPLGISTPPGVSSGLIPTNIGPAPLGGGVHAGSGAAPGPRTFAPSAGPGGGGFAGLGGLPMQGITSAIAAGSLALEAVAPGAGAIAGQAAQMGVQLANRTAGYIGQLGGIAVGGLLETALPHGSPLADPNKSWLGRIAAGFAGARPALPNQAGGGENPAGQSAKPQTPEEAAKLQPESSGGQGNGPMVQVGAINNYTPDGGQSLANQLGRMQQASYSTGQKR